MWCSLRNIQITASVLDMLTILCLCNRVEISKFCNILIKEEPSSHRSFSGKERDCKSIFSSIQSARNTILKAIEKGLIIRRGKKHEIEINPSMLIQKDDNLLVNYQFLSLDSN